QVPEYYHSLRISHGYPQLYYTFLANVLRAGMDDVITPLPTTSDNAAIILRSLGAQFDMVYVDAAHEYDAAKRDIENYYNLLADNGLLIVDDYMVWEGPTRSANEAAKQHNIPLIGRWGKFIMSKGTAQAKI